MNRGLVRLLHAVYDCRTPTQIARHAKRLAKRTALARHYHDKSRNCLAPLRVR